MVTILDNQIAVYIPGTNGTRQIDSARYVERALELFANLFGGSTIESRPRAHNVTGAWKDSRGNLITEDITIVESYTDKTTLAANIDTVRKWSLELKQELNQESFAIRVNQILELLQEYA